MLRPARRCSLHFNLSKSGGDAKRIIIARFFPGYGKRSIRNDIPRWKHLALTVYETKEPHDYQIAALNAWKQANRCGSIILPTGAGKTFRAIHAINQVSASTVAIVPTISLVHQWYVRLVNAFQTEIGVYYSSEKCIQPITVTTYNSTGI